MELKSVRGTRDILPPESFWWSYLESLSRKIFAQYGYQEIRTPILEEAGLFMRSVGETTDIVEKEMYTFSDRGGDRPICLRPEATAPVVRSYLEHSLDKMGSTAKFFYAGPMFRAERPQAGRSRQFHQMGVELIGSASAFADAEVIQILVHLLTAYGITGFEIHLNSLGCPQDRAALSGILRDALSAQRASLCPDCQRRVERNVFRVLDCKHETCRAVSKNLPTSLDHLCGECSEHLKTLQTLLGTSGIVYTLDPRLVRGLDYYTRTAFEITHPGLGAQDALGAGGRYDGLIQTLGGPPTPAIGFALGVERCLLVLQNLKAGAPASKPLDLFWVTIGPEAKLRAFQMMGQMRAQGLSADMDFNDRSVKGQMRQADKSGSRFTAILGDDELKQESVKLRTMASGQEETVPWTDLASKVRAC